VNDQSFGEQLKAQGAAPAFMNSKAFADFVGSERQKYAKLVKESGAKAD